MTWRDDVGEGAYEPVRAGWEVLDSARSIAFTGEIEFALMPIARVYLDRGRIYYAARDDDPDVADRLVAMGVVRPDDLARGVMVTSGIDHLGRMFDRVPTLDRERVMLALEQMTAATTEWVARQSASTPQSRPYTYHPSGIHQWYALPSVTRSVAAFAAPAPSDRPRRAADVLAAPPPPAPTPSGPEPVVDVEVDVEVGVDVDADPDLNADPDLDPDVATSCGTGSDLVDFELRWPSGEVEAPSPAVTPDPEPSAADGLERFDHQLDPPIASTDTEPAPDDDSETRDMTIAVRRAMAAVSAGTARGRTVAAVVPVLDDVPDPFDRWSAVERRSGPAVPDAGDPDPFDAPGTAGSQRSQAPLAPPWPTDPGRSDRGIDHDRRGALQRLIDGLRGG